MSVIVQSNREDNGVPVLWPGVIAEPEGLEKCNMLSKPTKYFSGAVEISDSLCALFSSSIGF